MRKFSLRTAVAFSVFVFLIVLVTVFLTMIITASMFRLGLLGFNSRWYITLVPVLASTLVGTLLSLASGKRVVSTVEHANEAIRQVAQGNFDVKLDENIPVQEMREIAQNFNMMTRELAGTEMLRNDFVENVSHEFKTPLTAIEGYVTLLQKKDLSEEKRGEYTQRILANTKRLNSLVGNILLLSRLENQELAIEKSRFSLDEQIRESLLLLEEQWSGKDLELDIDLAECEYLGNSDLLAQVWQNLLGNAFKFSPEGSAVRITLGQKEDGIAVSVSDSGSGIPPEVQKRIFEKFYQGDSSRSSQGNGLGLALVKRIVDLHGGKVTVDSVPGGGSTFTVVLPSVNIS